MSDETEFELRRTILKLRRQLACQGQYIQELENQLEHAEPGLLAEVREFTNENSEKNY